jgi:PleD family two-component response regulator
VVVTLRVTSVDSTAGLPLSWNRNAGKTARIIMFMPRRVLLVDDDVLVLDAVAYMLADLGCDTMTARSGTEALGTIAADQKIEILTNQRYQYARD